MVTASPGPRRRCSKRRLFLAFLVAGISDVVCAAFVWAPPVVWAIDVLTAALLFIVLGWSWFLLPGLFLEAVPGLEHVALFGYWSSGRSPFWAGHPTARSFEVNLAWRSHTNPKR